LLDNLSNCLMNLKNSGDSTGFEPMTSAMPVQCSNFVKQKHYRNKNIQQQKFDSMILFGDYSGSQGGEEGVAGVVGAREP